MERESIYCLIDPVTSLVFYIGKTKLPLRKRLVQHCAGAMNRFRCEMKNNYIRKLASNHNTFPIIELLEQCTDTDNAERFWIYHYLNEGHPITNSYMMEYHKLRNDTSKSN